MNNLEQIAKKYFEQFCVEQKGKVYSWYYLTKNRRLSWMQDVLDFYSLVIKDLNSKVSLEKAKKGVNTSYEQGKIDGINSERMYFKTFLDNLKNTLEKELEEYKNYT